MHAHGPAIGDRLKVAAAVTFLFVVVEFVVGWQANSLALVSDAGHNLTDVAALVLSAWAFAMARRPPDAERTFGYHRVGVLAALANALTLVVLAGYILYEGYQRLVHPEPAASLPMIVVAAIALVLNTSIALALHHGAHDVNVRSAFIHMAGDAASSVGVMLAGAAIWLTGSTFWDPVVSLLIALFILWSSWGIIRETIGILMESTPAGINLAALVRDVESITGVLNMHDVHVWSLSSNVYALAAHIALADDATRAEIEDRLDRVRQVLRDRYRIDHTTLETHCGDGRREIEEGLDCSLHPERLPASQEHAHQH